MSGDVESLIHFVTAATRAGDVVRVAREIVNKAEPMSIDFSVPGELIDQLRVAIKRVDEL